MILTPLLAIYLIISLNQDKTLTNTCYPDKGIKTAYISIKIKNTPPSKNHPSNKVREIEFNKEGQPIFIKNSDNGKKQHEWVYDKNKLKYIITTNKKLPEFYHSKDLDSILKNTPIETDTSIVLSHTSSGRPKILKNPDGTTLIFNYKGCKEEVKTLIDNNSDTIQTMHLINKKGILIHSIWTPYKPIKSRRVTKYFKYKVDKHGNWIQRSYKHQSHSIMIETRELVYY